MGKEKTKLKLQTPLKQTNNLTESKQLFRPSVYRTIKCIVRKIMENEMNLQSMIERKETLSFTIPINEIKSWYPNRLYERDLKDAAHWLSTKNVSYLTPNGWVYTQLVSAAEFNRETGLEVYIVPQALSLYHVGKEQFTLLDFDASMALTKKSSQFFYDKCCMWRSAKKFEYTPDELRSALDLKYPNNRIKQRILLPACEDLKNCFKEGITDLCFDIEEIVDKKSSGGAIIKWIFRIRTAESIENGNEILEALEYKRYILDSLKNIMPSYISNIAVQLDDISSDKLQDLYERINLLIEKDIPSKKIKDLKSYTFILLRDEFGINPNAKELIKSSSIKAKTQKKVITNNEEEFKQGILEFQENENWEKFLAKIKKAIQPEDFKIWFNDDAISFKSFNDKCLCVNVYSQVVYEKMESTYLETLKIALYEVYGGENLIYNIKNPIIK